MLFDTFYLGRVMRGVHGFAKLYLRFLKSALKNFHFLGLFQFYFLGRYFVFMLYAFEDISGSNCAFLVLGPAEIMEFLCLKSLLFAQRSGTPNIHRH